MFQLSNLRRGLLGTPMAPEYGTSIDSFEQGNPMDSLRRHQSYGTRYQSDPTGMGTGAAFGGFRFGGGSGPMSYGD